MPYGLTVVLNDYVHVDFRNNNSIVFEPLQPLVIPDSISGGVSAVGDGYDYRVYFTVGSNRIIYELPQWPSTDRLEIGRLTEGGVIILNNPKRYSNDIYLSISYELADEEQKYETKNVNWLTEGF